MVEDSASDQLRLLSQQIEEGDKVLLEGIKGLAKMLIAPGGRLDAIVDPLKNEEWS